MRMEGTRIPFHAPHGIERVTTVSEGFSGFTRHSIFFPGGKDPTISLVNLFPDPNPKNWPNGQRNGKRKNHTDRLPFSDSARNIRIVYEPEYHEISPRYRIHLTARA